ncbi:MAG: hypothetical protein QM657_14925 [Lacrimispora sp.]|uniref:hypothetical protein n=1 Tax=Lacrimispora sp. TaxID=2719234 RepID=UPI0039E23A30
MTSQKNMVFKDSTMVIEGNTVRWENHMLKTSTISQVWMGNGQKESFPVRLSLLLLFIALSGSNPVSIIGMLAVLALYLASWSYRNGKKKSTKGIHFESYSGKVYTFLSENDGFTLQAYELISETIAGGRGDANLQLSFAGDGKVISEEPPKEVREEIQVLNVVARGANEQVIKELQKLFVSFTHKNEANKEIAELIEETIRQFSLNDLAETKKSLSKFIVMGLINDCNELGLNALIGAIKSSVY